MYFAFKQDVPAMCNCGYLRIYVYIKKKIIEKNINILYDRVKSVAGTTTLVSPLYFQFYPSNFKNVFSLCEIK